MEKQVKYKEWIEKELDKMKLIDLATKSLEQNVKSEISSGKNKRA